MYWGEHSSPHNRHVKTGAYLLHCGYDNTRSMQNFSCFWLCWVFTAVSRGCSLLQCKGFSLQGLLSLQSSGSRAHGLQSRGTGAQNFRFSGSAAKVHRLSGFVACGIFLEQGSSPCLLHWQADSSLLSHQGSKTFWYIIPILGAKTLMK